MDARRVDMPEDLAALLERFRGELGAEDITIVWNEPGTTTALVGSTLPPVPLAHMLYGALEAVSETVAEEPGDPD